MVWVRIRRTGRENTQAVQRPTTIQAQDCGIVKLKTGGGLILWRKCESQWMTVLIFILDVVEVATSEMTLDKLCPRTLKL